MTDVTLADAKANLAALVDRAAAGEVVRITRRGKPVVQLTMVAARLKPIDATALHELTAAMPAQAESAGEWLRDVRDAERY